MEYVGTLELDDTTAEKRWRALSDPAPDQSSVGSVDPVNRLVKRFFSAVKQEPRDPGMPDETDGGTDDCRLADRLLGRPRRDKT